MRKKYLLLIVLCAYIMIGCEESKVDNNLEQQLTFNQADNLAQEYYAQAIQE